MVKNKNDDIIDIVKSLCEGSSVLALTTKQQCSESKLPSRDEIIRIVEDLRSALFPRYFGQEDFSDTGLEFHLGAMLDSVRVRLSEQIKRGLCFECGEGNKNISGCECKARKLTEDFLTKLPEIQRLLLTDVQAAFEGDPAAHSPDETIFCYPGIFSITNHRIAHELYKSGVPLIPRIIGEYAHTLTGIDIHPGAKIASHFFIDHGTGVVIGETSIIGSRVRIYQGVTLGAKSFPLDKDGKPTKGVDRHPIIEDNVIIYAGATVLGRITVGKGSSIGSNVWITKDVPRNRVVKQTQG